MNKKFDWLERRDRRLQEIDYHEAKLKEGIADENSPLLSLERALAIAEAKVDRLERIYREQLLSERKQHQWELSQLKEENQRLQDTLKVMLDEKDMQLIELLEQGLSIRAIAQEIGLSPGAVQYRKEKLKKRGLL